MTYFDIVEEFDNLKEFTHQREVLTHPYVLNPTKPIVLAFGTDGGKTFTSIIDLILYFSNPKNQGKKVLIIPASKGDTRDNFKDALYQFNGLDKYFKFCVVDDESSGSRMLGEQCIAAFETCDVVVALPQTVASVIDQLPKLGKLIVDEAHEWYLSTSKKYGRVVDGTVQRILKQTEPEQQMLLTGTPYDFNSLRDDYNILHYSVERLREIGKTGDAEMNVVSTTFNIDVFNDYDGENGLKRTAKITRGDVRRSLGKVFLEMEETLRLPGDIIKSNKAKRLQAVFGKLDKTIVYFRRQSHARWALKYLNQFTDAVISLGNDAENTVENFKYGKIDAKILIVVGKVRQGYSDNELFNVVDFTFSKKPSVLQQMYGRLLRISDLAPNKTKRYFKVAPKNDVAYFEELMVGIMCLNLQEYYESFEGKSSKLNVPRVKPKKPSKTRSINPGGGGREKKNNFTVLGEMREAGIPLSLVHLIPITRKTSDYFSLTGYSTMQQIGAQIYGYRGFHNETYDKCFAFAERKGYNNFYEWTMCEEGKSLAHYVSGNKWHKQIADELGWYSKQYRTVEDWNEFLKLHNLTSDNTVAEVTVLAVQYFGTKAILTKARQNDDWFWDFKRAKSGPKEYIRDTTPEEVEQWLVENGCEGKSKTYPNNITLKDNKSSINITGQKASKLYKKFRKEGKIREILVEKRGGNNKNGYFTSENHFTLKTK
jgi:hypothetical protein